jgi:translation initiation factor IF-3
MSRDGRVEDRGRSPEQHRVGRQIRVPQIMVIAADGEKLGVMTPDEARDIAAEQGLDLVEVAPRALPPVCKIMDYGKFRYEQSKKATQAKATRVEVKTITLRPKTDKHDLETKITQARGFIERGDRVKLVMRLRGRENAHKELWYEKIDAILKALLDIAVVSQTPRDEGRTITASLEPMGTGAPTPSP